MVNLFLQTVPRCTHDVPHANVDFAW